MRCERKMSTGLDDEPCDTAYTLYRETDSKEAMLRHIDWVHAHMDNGSMVCTTNVVQLLWYTTHVCNPPSPKVADNHKHYPMHQGLLCIPIHGGIELMVTC
jgi:hypothetical protein